jgi:hypothetical protein
VSQSRPGHAVRPLSRWNLWRLVMKKAEWNGVVLAESDDVALDLAWLGRP